MSKSKKSYDGLVALKDGQKMIIENATDMNATTDFLTVEVNADHNIVFYGDVVAYFGRANEFKNDTYSEAETQGSWIDDPCICNEHGIRKGPQWAHCSLCDFTTTEDMAATFNYCPICGAEMNYPAKIAKALAQGIAEGITQAAHEKTLSDAMSKLIRLAEGEAGVKE